MLQNLVGLLANNAYILARILGFAIAIPFHEVAHAYISDKLGDHTARDLGRLTLNPIKHIDPFGLIAMLTIGIGWAKPVPINPAYYKNRKMGMALTAAAGPLANLLLAYVSLLIYKIALYALLAGGLAAGAGMELVFEILRYFILINISLAIFNLLPVPPFDGSRILGIVLPSKQYFAIQKYERYVMYAVLALMVLLPLLTDYNPIGWLLSKANAAVFKAFDWGTGYIDAIAALLLA